MPAPLDRQDFEPFRTLLEVTSHPFESDFDDQLDRKRYLTPARPEECVTATFCGT